MRMDYDDFATELSRSYPRTPERFQRMVSQEVCAQMNKGKQSVRSRK